MAMKIAVLGGTGTLGRQVVDELRRRGHDVRVLSRGGERRVDLTTGAGLAVALEDCDVVVDASNDSSRSGAQTLVAGSRRLLDAEHIAGVRHHVGVSIVGCERVQNAYLRNKARQERVIERGPVPWTIVRATPFHELVASALGQLSRFRIVPVPRVRLQTVASADVARAVADVALGPPLRRRFEVVGPELADSRDVARRWRSITGRRTLLVPLPIPGRFGRALRDGALTAPCPDVRGCTGFVDWLTARGDRREAA